LRQHRSRPNSQQPTIPVILKLVSILVRIGIVDRGNLQHLGRLVLSRVVGIVLGEAKAINLGHTRACPDLESKLFDDTLSDKVVQVPSPKSPFLIGNLAVEAL
jgi:hypothetical protein